MAETPLLSKFQVLSSERHILIHTFNEAERQWFCAVILLALLLLMQWTWLNCAKTVDIYIQLNGFAEIANCVDRKYCIETELQHSVVTLCLKGVKLLKYDNLFFVTLHKNGYHRFPCRKKNCCCSWCHSLLLMHSILITNSAISRLLQNRASGWVDGWSETKQSTKLVNNWFLCFLYVVC